MPASVLHEARRPSRRFRAVFANVASSRRSPEVLPSSAIIGCLMSRKPFEGDAMTWCRIHRTRLGARPPISTACSPRMRPKLHRYCARMVGSVIDGEDVLQDALIKAVESFAVRRPDRQSGRLAVPDRAQYRAGFPAPPPPAGTLRSAEEMDMIADPIDAVISRQIAGASLRTFMRLPVAQRSSVILMDVLGCSLQRSLRGDGFQPAGGEGGAASRPHPAARTGRRAGRFAACRNCRRPTAIASAPMSRTSTPAISTPSAP